MHVLEFKSRSVDEWTKALSGIFMPLAPVSGGSALLGEKRRPPRFQAELTGIQLGDGISLADVRMMEPISGVRSKRLAAATARDDLLVFCVHLTGSARVGQYDRVAEVTSGDGVLYDGREPLELFFPSDMRSVSLMFPRDLLPLRPNAITAYCAKTLDASSPAMRILAGYISHLSEAGASLTEAQRYDAGHAAAELIGMALRGIAQPLPGLAEDRDVLLATMRRYVRTHLGESSLSVAQLAGQHHVSVRHVYAQFARIGTTPAAYVREQRLDAARALLDDPDNHARPVSSIAASAGFTELTTFERAFQRQYGTTPGRWRREH